MDGVLLDSPGLSSPQISVPGSYGIWNHRPGAIAIGPHDSDANVLRVEDPERYAAWRDARGMCPLEASGHWLLKQAWSWEQGHSDGVQYIPDGTESDIASAWHSENPQAALPAGVYFRGKAEREINRVEYADGGRLLRFRGPRSGGPVSRGDRSPVTEFTGRSKHNLLCFMESIDRREITDSRWWFGTLTYPDVWSKDFRVWKRQLQNLWDRLERKYGAMPCVWKLEPQKRGAPHFHFIALVSPEMAAGVKVIGRRTRNGRDVPVFGGDGLWAFRRWLSQAWYEVVGSGNPDHLAAGTSLEPMETWNGVAFYASKYLGKDADFLDAETGECLSCGRFWGVRRRELFPIRMIYETLGAEHWIKVRRILRKYQEKQGRDFRGRDGRPPAFQWIGHARPTSAFVPAAVVRGAMACVCWWSPDMPYHELWKHCEDTKVVVAGFDYMN